MDFQRLNEINKLVSENPTLTIYTRISVSQQIVTSVSIPLEIASVSIERIYDGGDVMFPVVGNEAIAEIQVQREEECGFTSDEAKSQVQENTHEYIVITMSPSGINSYRTPTL